MMVAHYKPDVVDLHQELKTPSRDRRQAASSRAPEDVLSGTSLLPGERLCGRHAGASAGDPEPRPQV